MPLSKISELDLTDSIAKKINSFYAHKSYFRDSSSVILGIGDDAAVLKYTKNEFLLFTCDMLIEDVDFGKEVAPYDIGHKALACSLSDIAAMGGWPKYALISLGLPKQNPKEFISGFYEGALRLAGDFKVSIVGGDLSSSEKIIIDVSAIGEVKKRNLILRSGAKPKDIIFVTGSLGGSIYGKHLKFKPRLKEARYLVSNYKVSSMMDVSDGLSLDLYRLASMSKVGAAIYEDLIPVSIEAKSFDEALNMGEDFELLFTVEPGEAIRLVKIRGQIFKPIGEIREKSYGLKIITNDCKEKELRPKGYQHF